MTRMLSAAVAFLSVALCPLQLMSFPALAAETKSHLESCANRSATYKADQPQLPLHQPEASRKKAHGYSPHPFDELPHPHAPALLTAPQTAAVGPRDRSAR